MKTTRYAHIISHTHWDREWYLNSRYTNEWLVPFFEALFRMMEKEPAYRFVLDGQTCIIEDYFEQLKKQQKDINEYKARIKKYASEKRLIVGPYYLQPDWQLISEESLVRNLLIGMNMASEYGEPMMVGWLLDNFGQISQAPQIHKEFGMTGLFVWRGVEMEPEAVNSEFLWESPDGTGLPCVYFLSSYRNAMRLAEYDELIGGRIESETGKIAPFATTPNVLLMNGYDQEMAPDDIIPYIENGKLDFKEYKVVQSTPQEYMDAVLKHKPALKRLKGALYSGRYISVFPGILSSRMYLKIQNDISQKEIEKFAEPIQAILWSLGGEYPQESLARAWKTLLKNHPHDSICGVSIDDVHTDMENRLEEAYQLSHELAGRGIGALVSNIDTSKYENALFCNVVFNTLAVSRDGIVAVKNKTDKEFILKDGFGNILPVQRDKDGYVKTLLRNIPAMGYATIYALPEGDGPAASVKTFSPLISTLPLSDGPAAPVKTFSPLIPTLPLSDGLSPSEKADTLLIDRTKKSIENKYIKVYINEDGTLDVSDKENGVLYANIAALEDGADSGDEYNYSYPERDIILSSMGKKAEITFEESGPLRAAVKVKTILDIPEGLTEDRSAREGKTRKMPVVTLITIDVNSPVIRFKTAIKNTVKDHRVRVLFPTGIRTDISCAETQFDVAERRIKPQSFDNSRLPDNVRRIIIGAREPEPVTIFPQRSFVDLSDNRVGAAVMNRGLPEYETIEDGNVIALTLFRGVGWIARDDLKTRLGDAGPAIRVPDAQCLRTMEFDYAFYPHRGDWKEGRVPPAAEQFNVELVTAASHIHSGALGDAQGFVCLEDCSGLLKVTAVKRSEDGGGLIIRLCNPAAEAVEGNIRLFNRIKNAHYANLNEDITEDIGSHDEHSVRVRVGAKKIVTLKVEIDIESVPERYGDINPEILRRTAVGFKDFDGFEPLEAASPREIALEEERAAELEVVFREKEVLLERFMYSEGPNAGTDSWKINSSKIRLELETCRRAFLEARLSALLLKKNYIERQYGQDKSCREEMEEIDSKIRDTGYCLNRARVSKRVHEYLLDFILQNSQV